MTRKESKLLFKKCQTLDEFLELWSMFYENKIWLPYMYGLFVGSTDNPQATFNMGEKFKQMTQKGIIVHSSQVTIPYIQKGYINAYVPRKIIGDICIQLNRYNNIIAYANDLNSEDDINYYLYVTYEQHPKEVPSKLMVGKERTHVGGIDYTVMYSIHKWINQELSETIKSNNYVELTVINPCFDSNPEYVIDVLLEVINTI